MINNKKGNDQMISKLIDRIEKTAAPIVVGLDPKLNFVPDNIKKRCFEEKGEKPVIKRSAMIFLSDHANFKNSVMVSYTKKSLIGLLYLPLIHTSKDTVCDVEQINQLTDDVFSFAKEGII